MIFKLKVYLKPIENSIFLFALNIYFLTLKCYLFFNVWH